MIVGSGWPLGPKGPKKKAQAMTANRMAAAKTASFQAASGDKGDAGLFGKLVVFALVGGLADDSAGHGPVADAVEQRHPDMDGDPAEQETGNDEKHAR